MTYRNKIKPNQFIGVIAFLIGVSFACAVVAVGSFDHWVSYWGALYSFLFIIAAPAYCLNWAWSEKILISAFVLFIGYNIYNTTVDCLEGSDGAYVGIPICIASVCVIIAILNNARKAIPGGKYIKKLTFFQLFCISMIVFWLWMFLEMIRLLIKEGFQVFVLIAVLWSLLLVLLTIGLFLKVRFYRNILSVLIHIQLILFLLIEIISGKFDNPGTSITLVFFKYYFNCRVT